MSKPEEPPFFGSSLKHGANSAEGRAELVGLTFRNAKGWRLWVLNAFGIGMGLLLLAILLTAIF